MRSATSNWPFGYVFRALPAALACLIICAGYAGQSEWRRRAEVAFSLADDRAKAAPADIEAQSQFARAAYELAEYSTNATERATLANLGIEAARAVIKAMPNLASGHYYLAINLGQLARTRYLSALKLVGQMEREFLKARELDPGFDYAGADRSLGLLYRDAPSVGSIGSRRKAQHHFSRAVELAPTYPGNRLFLIESLLKWGDRTGASRESKELEAVWDKARKELTGPERESDWADWEARKEKVAERLHRGLPGIKSPRDR